MEIDPKKIDYVLMKNRRDRNALIPILQDIQAELNWLPEEALEIVALELGIPLIDVYGVTTFYRTFSLKPRGKHIVTVCLGTACHVRGGQRITETISRELKINSGETTKDLKFTLETVNCLGCCAIGPIVVVDGEYYGGMTSQKALALLKRTGREEA
ncbi:MAG: NADH-quinone oxidoreductase subunit NuoE [Candidatus Cloacimonadota bacterium]|nr:MAG: NADH-quinone oxidoreductase subunit NuoE [Candidatus Cloacimonadota bacterium]